MRGYYMRRPTTASRPLPPPAVPHFLAPPGVAIGPYTECGACGARKNEHEDGDTCPPHPTRWLDEATAT